MQGPDQSVCTASQGPRRLGPKHSRKGLRLPADTTKHPGNILNKDILTTREPPKPRCCHSPASANRSSVSFSTCARPLQSPPCGPGRSHTTAYRGRAPPRKASQGVNAPGELSEPHAAQHLPAQPAPTAPRQASAAALGRSGDTGHGLTAAIPLGQQGPAATSGEPIGRRREAQTRPVLPGIPAAHPPLLPASPPPPPSPPCPFLLWRMK